MPTGQTSKLILAILACGALLGVAVSSASAFDAPEVESLGREIEGVHPPVIELPHIAVPSTIQGEFGTDDLRVTGALHQDETAVASAVTDAADKVTDEDTAGEDAIKKCLAAGLLAIISEVLEATEPVSIEEATRNSLNPCFDKLAPDNAKLALELTDYFSKTSTEQADKAYTDSGANAVVFANWLRRTAATVEPHEAPGPEPDPEPEPTPDPSKTGISTGGIIAITIIVLGIGAGIVRYKRRRT